LYFPLMAVGRYLAAHGVDSEMDSAKMNESASETIAV
jgi:hypothetical protein